MSEVTDRFRYHPVRDENDEAAHTTVRAWFVNMAEMLEDVLPTGPARTVAFYHLQDAMHWANHAIAMERPVETHLAGTELP